MFCLSFIGPRRTEGGDGKHKEMFATHRPGSERKGLLNQAVRSSVERKTAGVMPVNLRKERVKWL